MPAPWRSETRRSVASGPDLRVRVGSHRGPKQWPASARSSTPHVRRSSRSSPRGFSDHAETLGLIGAAISYAGRGVTVEELEQRFVRDVERGTTGAGPHLRDVSITAGSRDLRAYGSQGEQRVAVLALVLAEAAVLAEERGEAPLLLLDDVLSELDDRREGLARGGASDGRTGIHHGDVAAVSPAREPRSGTRDRRDSGPGSSTVSSPGKRSRLPETAR